MNPIPCVWTDLEIAFERNGPDVQSYLRASTGEVVTVLEGGEDAAQWRARIAEHPEDFILVEPCSSREQYRWMEYFVGTVEEPDLRQRLLIAIDGKGAFRRFKDVLLSFPIERERWFNYRSLWLRWHINKWLQRAEIPTAEPPPWGDVEPPQAVEPPSRPTLVKEVIGDAMRKRVHDAVEVLPPGELPAALVFLEFLNDRGSTELSSARVKLDTNLRRVAAARAAALGVREDATVDEVGDDDAGEDIVERHHADAVEVGR